MLPIEEYKQKLATLKEHNRGQWIGVDFDGVLATYNGWKGPDHCGEPIWPMVEKVKGWLAAGTEVRILTSRVGRAYPEQVDRSRKAIEAWCREVFGRVLPVTCEKDQKMFLFFDDNAVEMITNTGMTRYERFSN